jgi:predicted nucleic acid-binding protein
VSVYADTSFLVSLYVLDSNSALAAARMEQVKLPILLTPFGELELTNAISLRLFRRELPASNVKAAQSLFRKDLAQGVLLLTPLPEGVFDRAMQMVRRRTAQIGTRTLDVLHVASALKLGVDLFFTFDLKQEKLAIAEGLRGLERRDL